MEINDKSELESKLQWHSWKNGVRVAYLVGYFLLFLSVAAAVFIIKNAGTIEPSNPSGGATFRIEQISPVQH